LSDETNEVVLPSVIRINNIAVDKKSKIILLDAPNAKIKWKKSVNGITITMPSIFRKKSAGYYAVAFKITE
jgi:hypothetical protein